MIEGRRLHRHHPTGDDASRRDRHRLWFALAIAPVLALVAMITVGLPAGADEPPKPLGIVVPSTTTTTAAPPSTQTTVPPPTSTASTPPSTAPATTSPPTPSAPAPPTTAAPSPPKTTTPTPTTAPSTALPTTTETTAVTAPPSTPPPTTPASAAPATAPSTTAPSKKAAEEGALLLPVPGRIVATSSGGAGAGGMARIALLVAAGVLFIAGCVVYGVMHRGEVDPDLEP